ncbi:MAG: hypothetical protein JKX81_18800, partial [Arenicella sp.]|nr:hypothetical protein [Arenicella sp.]
VRCPARIVTVDGTVASVVSLLERVTVSADVVSVLRDTVAVVAAKPAFLLIESLAITTDNSGTSSSATVSVSVPLACPGAEAVKVTVCVPSTIKCIEDSFEYVNVSRKSSH